LPLPLPLAEAEAGSFCLLTDVVLNFGVSLCLVTGTSETSTMTFGSDLEDDPWSVVDFGLADLDVDAFEVLGLFDMVLRLFFLGTSDFGFCDMVEVEFDNSGGSGNDKISGCNSLA